MSDLNEIYNGCKSLKEYSKKYLEYLSILFSEINLEDLEKILNTFEKARKNENTIFITGNGGSAATASHMSEDLSKGTYVEGKKPFKTMSLTDNSAYITALANDEGYENIFVGQLKCFLKKDDVVVSISASGNSPNLIKAIKYANLKGAITVGILGFDGGKMRDMCKYNIVVETKKGMYGPVEDIHLILEHIISTYLMYKLRYE
jgi:D-sedoheptulose 7-phosphate isomerase